MLFLTEGSEKDRLLRSTIEDHLEQRDGELFLKDSKPHAPPPHHLAPLTPALTPLTTFLSP